MKFLVKFNTSVTTWLSEFSVPLARIALFIVFFWFGALKLFGESPAGPLVEDLLEHTLPFMTFETFIVCLGIYEMIIGILFLIPGIEQLSLVVFLPHLFMTTGPLVLLPEVTWASFMIPTLEGQYIIKNLLIVALAVLLASRLRKSKEGAIL